MSELTIHDAKQAILKRLCEPHDEFVEQMANAIAILTAVEFQQWEMEDAEQGHTCGHVTEETSH